MKALGHLYFLLGLGAFVAVALGFSLYRVIGRRYRLPYVADTVLYPPGHLAFLAVLERALGKGYRVFGPVRAADVIDVRRRLDRRTRRLAWERLGDRRLDFLVCHARTSAIACAVNLAPRSRVLGRGIPRDMLDRICAAAGLPLVRFRESRSYSVVEIEERIFAAIQAAGRGLPEDRRAQPLPAAELDALDALAGAIRPEDRRPVAGRAPRASPAPAAQAPVLRPPAAQAQSRPEPKRPEPALTEQPRLEPVIGGTGDLDLGPSFSIEGGLEDEEQPPRKRQRR